MKIYAVSDIHGCIAEFEDALQKVDLSGANMLILLGDYVHGPDSRGVVRRIMSLQNTYGTKKVVALMGNHEEMVLDGSLPLEPDDGATKESDKELLRWMSHLPRFYKTETQIFVHAGVDEEADDMWEWGTDDYTFTSKFPAQTGRFCMDIIAGHIGTYAISGNPQFHDIYYDGASHYYLDGSTVQSGVLPLLMYNTATKKYYRITDNGASLIRPYSKAQ